ncbi:MAG: DUF222 domain-containing protein [Acidimicrobiia bacterium]|nr:DUF222 domain-containing protein [Acidimicrobiia bacterium]
MGLADVYELNTGSDETARRFADVIADLRSMPTAEALALSDGFQNQLLALDAELVAAEIGAGANDRNIEDLCGRGTTRTKREAKKRANRAKAVNANPALGNDLAGGALTPEGLDAIAAVSEKSDGAAAHDLELIENVKAALPDQATALTRKWLDDHTEPDQHEKRYQRQRRLRTVTRYYTRDGLEGIRAEGDKEAIAEIWATLKTESKHLYRADGGRNLPPDKHPRTRSQRLFDAFHTALTTGHTGSDDSDAMPKRNVQVYVTLTLQELIDGATKARLVGGGTIPQTLLDKYLPDATIAGVLFNGDGHVLWHSRNKRWATINQTSALIARDEGCVLCNTTPGDCESHHLIPYNSPARGHTNTDELALVCSDCHHHIHTTKQTLQAHSNPRKPGQLTWKLRPATPNELPP